MIKNNITKLVFVVLLFFLVLNLGSQDIESTKSKIKKVLITKIVRTITEENEVFVLLNKKYTQVDNKGLFVFKLIKSTAHKTYLNYSFNENKECFMILKGLKKGDEIVTSVLINIGEEVIQGKFISKLSKIPVIVMHKDKRYGKYIKKKKEKNETKDVKYEFEIGIGYSSNDFKEFYVKDKTYETLIKQYANINGLSQSASGNYPELGSFMPISLGLNYKISKDLYIKGGIEFASTSANAIKEVEKRFKDFGVYANIGLNSIKYNYEMISSFSEQEYSENITETINGSGKAFSIILGIKYKKRIIDKLHGIIKIEYMLSKLSSITADRSMQGSNSEGETVSSNDSGLIYTYDTNPYNSTKISTWGVFDNIPTTSSMDNFNEIGLNLSTIRISLGLSF